MFKARTLSPISNKVAPIDADIFNRTKSFFITNDDDANQLPISLPMPVNESDFSQANLALNNAPQKEVENVVIDTPELDQLFNMRY